MITHSIEQDRVVVYLPAELGGSGVSELREFFLEQMGRNRRCFVADASRLTFIDSVAIGFLVQILNDLQGKGGYLALRNLQGEAFNFFQRVGLTKIFPSAEDVETEISGVNDDFADVVDLKLKMEVESTGGVCVIRLMGVMDYPGGSLRFKEKALLCLQNHKRFLLDLEELDYLHSLSVTEILNLHRILAQSEGELRICRANELVKGILATLSANKVIRVYESREDALSGWAG